MKYTIKTAALGLLGWTLLATLAVAQGRAEGKSRSGEHRFGARHGEATGFEKRADRRAGARKFVRSLDLTEAQRALVRQETLGLAPAARAAHDEARAIREAARARGRDGDREGARAQAREQMRALRDRTRAEFAPHGRAVIQSLSPEQRARIEARLAERGKTFDAERASERVGRWMARPKVQARVGAGPEHGPRTGR